MFRCADDAPSGGIIGAAVSESVHYIRRESGRCLTRALRVGAGVNQLGESKTETRRTGGERVWNEAGLAGRPRRGRNGETNGDGSYSKDYGKAKGRGVNQRAGKSVELDNLAPRDEHRSEHILGEPSVSSILRPLTKGRIRRGTFVVGGSWQ